MFLNFSFDLVSNRGILTKIRLEDIHDTWVSDCREYWLQHLSYISYQGEEFENRGHCFFFSDTVNARILARIEFYNSRYWR